jgi:hypothetical protein
VGRYCIVDIRAWEGAGELEVGDHIWSISGEWGRVEAVSVSHDPQLMYNLAVDDAHTFFVGKQAWLVHNTCIVGNYEDLQKIVKDLKNQGQQGLQVHHLNQNAVYGDVIPYNKGISVIVNGSIQTPGSQHFNFHEYKIILWEPHRLAGTKPTNAQYIEAVEDALTYAGFTAQEARDAATDAQNQLGAYNFVMTAEVPRVPNPIYNVLPRGD